MAIKIEMLRAFVAVAQAGTLAEAAERMGRTQSAVSMTLKQLEDHLGRRLFEGERKNRLSPLGEQVLALARVQLRQFDDTLDNIKMAADAPLGVLRIVAVPSVAALVFPQVAADVSARYPGMRLDLRDSDSHQVIEELSQGQADIGLASGRQAVKGVLAQPLFEDRFGLVCAQTHVLAQQQAAPSIAQVMAAGFLRNPLCDLVSTAEFCEAMQGADVMVHNTQSLTAMMRGGAWVTVLPQTVVRAMGEGLVFREITGIEELRQVTLYLRERSRFPEITREVGAMIAAMQWGG